MMQKLEFNESDWQILYCVEARFPGFTREVWGYYWRYTPPPDESSREPQSSLEERARILSEKFDIDLTVVDGNERKAASSIKDWVSGVDEYYDQLGKLKARELYVEFKKSLGCHSLNSQEGATSTDDYEGVAPEAMLRYAYWNIDDALTYFSKVVSSPDLDKCREDLKASIGSGVIHPEDKPSEFIKVAQSEGWVGEFYNEDVSSIYPDSKEYYIAKRKRTLLVILISLAIEYCGFKPSGNNSAARVIDHLTSRYDVRITSETVRKILRDAWDNLNEDDREKFNSAISNNIG